jgi:predicted TIM-barrel fold metal-dependent hydrolase
VIIDLNAFTGTWLSHPVVGDLPNVRDSLRSYGVERIFVSPLEAAWCRNPHRFNQALYQAAAMFDDVWPMPVLDPTIATWRKELAVVVQQAKVRLVRLLPAYSPYRLSKAGALLEALVEVGLSVIVQTRLEDPRRQHPLAQVPDLPATAIAKAAARHPALTLIIGGPRLAEIRALKAHLLDLPNLYADVSQADGLDAVKVLVEDGLAEKLVFGSHAPLFIPYAALSRVLADVDDDTATKILGGNAERVLGGKCS